MRLIAPEKSAQRASQPFSMGPVRPPEEGTESCRLPGPAVTYSLPDEPLQVAIDDAHDLLGPRASALNHHRFLDAATIFFPGLSSPHTQSPNPKPTRTTSSGLVWNSTASTYKEPFLQIPSRHSRWRMSRARMPSGDRPHNLQKLAASLLHFDAPAPKRYCCVKSQFFSGAGRPPLPRRWLKRWVWQRVHQNSIQVGYNLLSGSLGHLQQLPPILQLRDCVQYRRGQKA